LKVFHVETRGDSTVMILKKAIPRRTFLRGMGVTMALPLLDGMIPAFARDAPSRSPLRLSVHYCPNGILMSKWTPLTEGAFSQLTPILEPLAAHRDSLLVLSGLAHNKGIALEGEGVGDHARASAAFLTGVHPRRTEGADIQAGISFDQIVATEFGKETQLASLELSTDLTDVVGTCDTGYSCAYSNTISWRTATTPLPMINEPRVVFERMFGDSESTSIAERMAQMKQRRSILDWVMQDASRFEKGLTPGDRNRLTEYLDAIRDIERRIQKAEEQSSREVPTFERPVGVPDTFTEHCKLMIDLEVLAFQTDLTRVSTFMLGREQSTRVYRELGISDAHHALTHHQGDPQKIAKCQQIDTLHAQMFAYYLDKLKATPDGDGCLLDHSVNLYGAGLSDGNMHIHNDVPWLVVAAGSTGIRGGRHLRFPKDTPSTNLYLALLDRFNLPVEKFGDATGKIDLLAV
jgi:hypothetical protein